MLLPFMPLITDCKITTHISIFIQTVELNPFLSNMDNAENREWRQGKLYPVEEKLRSFRAEIYNSLCRQVKYCLILRLLRLFGKKLTVMCIKMSEEELLCPTCLTFFGALKTSKGVLQCANCSSSLHYLPTFSAAPAHSGFCCVFICITCMCLELSIKIRPLRKIHCP